MSEKDIQQAQLEVNRATTEFDRAMDDLKAVLEAGTARVQQAADMIRSPRKVTDQLLDVAEERLKETTQRAVAQGRVWIDNRIGKYRQTALDAVQQIDQRPLASWASVFFTGYLLGVFMTRRVARRREIRAVEPLENAPIEAPTKEIRRVA